MKRLLAHRLRQLVIPVTIGLAAGGSTADTIHVNCTATPPGDGSPQSPFKTIQEGVTAANEGDTVLVHDCAYDYFGPGNRDIDFLGKGIVVTSENGPANCVIVCGTPQEQPHRGFIFQRGEGRDSVVQGFTIRGGRGGDSGNGGAIWCQDSSPTIIGNRLLDNEAVEGSVFRGGAISCEDSSPLIQDNEISGNTARYRGGGIACDGGEPEIIDNIISGNSTGNNRGGGIYCSGSIATIRGNLIADNVSDMHGGGIFGYGGTMTITGNTITGNTAGKEGGGLAFTLGSQWITGNKIVGNSAAHGGGMRAKGQYSGNTTTITCNLIADNEARYRGGGLYYYDGNWCSTTLMYNVIIGNRARDWGGGLDVIFSSGLSTTTIKNCLIAGNMAGAGGGMRVSQTQALIANTTIANNRALSGNGAGIYCSGVCPTIIDSILWENSADDLYECCSDLGYTTYSCIQDGDPGVGNIFYDPLFAVSGHWDDNDTPADLSDDVWVHGDYHLLPGSPCMDTGDPHFLPDAGETDLDGESRLCDGDGDGWPTVDMGADEFVSSIADVDCNGQVGLLDYRGFAGCMTGPGGGTPCQCGVFELDGDNDIDLDDFAVFQNAYTAP